MSEPILRHHFTKLSFDWIVELYEDRIEFYNGEGTRLYESVPLASILGVDYDEREGYGGSLCLHHNGKRADFSFDECDREIAESYIGELLERIPMFNPVFILSVNDDCEVRYREGYFEGARPDFYVNIYGSVEIFALYDEKFTIAKDCYFDQGDEIPYAEVTELSMEEETVSDNYSHFVLSFTHGERKYSFPVSKKNLSEMRACFKTLSTKVRQFAKTKERKDIFTVSDELGNVYEFNEEHIVKHDNVYNYTNIIPYEKISLYDVEEDIHYCTFYEKETMKSLFCVKAGAEIVEVFERFAAKKLISLYDYVTSIYGESGKLVEEHSSTSFYENFVIIKGSTCAIVSYRDIFLVQRQRCNIPFFKRLFDRFAAYFADYKVCVYYQNRLTGKEDVVTLDWGEKEQKRLYRRLCGFADKWSLTYYRDNLGKTSYHKQGKTAKAPNNFLVADFAGYYEFCEDELIVHYMNKENQHIPYKNITKMCEEYAFVPQKRRYFCIYEKEVSLHDIYLGDAKAKRTSKALKRMLNARIKR